MQTKKKRDYERYKKLCKEAEESAHQCKANVSEMNAKELDSYLQTILKLKDKLDRCAEQRQEFALKYFASENRDDGHKQAIEFTKSMANVCNNQLEQVAARFEELQLEAKSKPKSPKNSPLLTAITTTEPSNSKSKKKKKKKKQSEIEVIKSPKIEELDKLINDITVADTTGINPNFFDPNFTDFKSFDEAIEYNLLFLNGVLPYTFYHAAPVDDETIPLLGKLKAINSYGFFSMDGQPAEHDIIPDPENPKIQLEGMQKSYIMGYVKPSKNARALIAYLLKNENIYFEVINIVQMAYRAGKLISYNYDRFGNIPVGERNITKDRRKVNGKWSQWRYYTNIPDEAYFEFKDIKIFTDCLQIQIIGKEYNQGSVEDELLKFYRKK